ncbi:hypothetical protein SAMN05192583_1205 [Sphingomonas gellani]|uniref:Uncharacterized protein n=1 Tax=Sphingomonas gellani TaxID=1166340 RepID=A0A1H8B4Y5_9SPHN|nr:hypothetical protein [Sphingomonas gellani]SEM78005.1 hypothetical protein SAMN05192583_1205 [Sphingomonas gellani]
MWWKLVALMSAATVLIFCIIPVRTHAALFDPANLPPKLTIRTMVANMYFTPGTIVAIAAIIAVATALGIWIVRSA